MERALGYTGEAGVTNEFVGQEDVRFRVSEHYVGRYFVLENIPAPSPPDLFPNLNRFGGKIVRPFQNLWHIPSAEVPSDLLGHGNL